MIEVILDASQLEVVEACLYKWFMDQVCNLTTRRTNPALSTGTFYHEVLKYYYSAPLTPRSNNIGPTVRFAERLAVATVLTDELKAREVDRVGWPAVNKEPKFHLDRLRSYLITHMNEDDTSEVVAVEKGFSTLLYEDSNNRFILEGMIDMISVERSTGLTVTDHKTQSRFYDKYGYNHQALNYLSFTKANYFRYNYIGLQDKQGDNTFRRPIFKPVEGMLDQWRLDVKGTFLRLAEVIRTACDLLQVNPTELFTLTAEQRLTLGISGIFARNRQGCDTKFGLCQFHRRCEVPDNSKWVPTVLTAFKEKEMRWRAWS